jgi:streptogramin lyase
VTRPGRKAGPTGRRRRVPALLAQIACAGVAVLAFVPTRGARIPQTTPPDDEVIVVNGYRISRSDYLIKRLLKDEFGTELDFIGSDSTGPVFGSFPQDTGVVISVPFPSDSQGTVVPQAIAGPAGSGGVFCVPYTVQSGSLTKASGIFFIQPPATFNKFVLPDPTAFEAGGDVVFGSDNKFHFTELLSNKLGEIDLSGTITEHLLPPGHNPSRIVTGDSTLWVLYSAGLDNVGTDGSLIHSYPSPRSDSTFFGVTRSTDGKYYISDSGAPNAIWRFDPSGQYTPFSIPTPNSFPEGIGQLSDGNLYFSCFGASKIGRLNPTTSVIDLFGTPSSLRPRELYATGTNPDGLATTDSQMLRIDLSSGTNPTPTPIPSGPTPTPGSGCSQIQIDLHGTTHCVVGQFCSFSFLAHNPTLPTGGTYTYTFSGNLPPGLTAAGNRLSGTPSQIGNFPIAVLVAGGGCTASRTYVADVLSKDDIQRLLEETTRELSKTVQ